MENRLDHRLDSEPRMEWQAGYACGALLMPATAFRTTVRQFMDERSIAVGRFALRTLEAEALILRELSLAAGQTVLYFLEQYIDGLPLGSVYKPMPTNEVFAPGLCVSEVIGVLGANGYVQTETIAIRAWRNCGKRWKPLATQGTE